MRVLLILTIICVSLQLQAPPAFAQSSTLERGRQARAAGRIDEAEPLLRETLRRDPANYMALYNMGLVYEQRALRAPGAAQRLQDYRIAAGWLEQALRSPGRAGSTGDDPYTIFNSLGAMYLGLSDLAQATRYLEEGLRNQQRLDPGSKAKLFTNFGYLMALRGNNAEARRYFQRAADLGNSQAQDNLRRMDEAGLR